MGLTNCCKGSDAVTTPPDAPTAHTTRNRLVRELAEALQRIDEANRARYDSYMAVQPVIDGWQRSGFAALAEHLDTAANDLDERTDEAISAHVERFIVSVNEAHRAHAACLAALRTAARDPAVAAATSALGKRALPDTPSAEPATVTKKLAFTTPSPQRPHLPKKPSPLARQQPVPVDNADPPPPDTTAEEFARIDARLAAIGRRRVSVPGDGNCLFHALAHCVRADPACTTALSPVLGDSPAALRVSLVDYVVTHNERLRFDEYLCDGEALWQWATRMRQPGCWGDQLVLKAAADKYGVSLTLITSVKGDDRATNIVHQPGERRRLRPWYLAYRCGNHYDATEPVPEPAPAPAPAQSPTTVTEVTIAEDATGKQFLLEREVTRIDASDSDSDSSSEEDVPTIDPISDLDTPSPPANSPVPKSPPLSKLAAFRSSGVPTHSAIKAVNRDGASRFFASAERFYTHVHFQQYNPKARKWLNCELQLRTLRIRYPDGQNGQTVTLAEFLDRFAVRETDDVYVTRQAGATVRFERAITRDQRAAGERVDGNLEVVRASIRHWSLYFVQQHLKQYYRATWKWYRYNRKRGVESCRAFKEFPEADTRRSIRLLRRETPDAPTTAAATARIQPSPSSSATPSPPTRVSPKRACK